MIKKIILLTTFLLLVATVYVAQTLSQLPDAKEIRGCLTTTMYHVYLCPGTENYVPLKLISPHMQKVVILTEDANFWNHKGFDWDSIEKNAKENLEKGTYKRGGSTITQQLAKNMFLYKEKSIVRKLIEALITQRIENSLSKKEILERYLNVIEFGKNIYGIKAASQFYFNKSASELNVTESAFLAMILPNPQKYARSYFSKALSPFARKRMSQIINSMYKYNRIDQTEYDIAMTQLDNFLNKGSAAAKPPDDNSQEPSMSELETDDDSNND